MRTSNAFKQTVENFHLSIEYAHLQHIEKKI